MPIAKIISYKGAWEQFKQKNQSEFDDIKEGIEDCFHLLQREKNYIFKSRWEATMVDKGWSSGIRMKKSSNGSVGAVKNKIAALAVNAIDDYVNKWLFRSTVIAIRNGVIEIPILILPCYNLLSKKSVVPGLGGTFEATQHFLRELSPLSHPYKFIVIGVSNEDPQELEVFDIEADPLVKDEDVIIDRCIEFPPEYHQAGVDILSYFGTYLRKQYPEQAAKVRIEQYGLIVRLVIESKDGTSEVIEKALHEYQLIVTGQDDPSMFIKDPMILLELRNELRIAQFRIESQKEMMLMQQGTVSQLMSIVKDGLTNKATLIDFKSNVFVTVDLNMDISSAIGAVNELKELLPRAGDVHAILKDLEGSLEAIEKEKDKETIRKSAGMNKFRRFLDKISDGNDTVRKIIDTAEDGINILQDLSGKYNKIAEWCGLPQVPSVFVKK